MRPFATGLATLAAIGLSLTAVSAADLPLKAPLPGVSQFSWTGCYVGVQGGGGAFYDTWSVVHGNGGLAGGQAGCNYQTGILVFGIEGDGLWSGVTDNFMSRNGNAPFINSQTTATHNRWDFDAAGRVGVALDRVLIYGKAGWVWGRFDFSGSSTFDGIPTLTQAGNATLNGLLIGLGAEYAFGAHLSAKFEYNYWNFGAKSVLIANTIISGPGASSTFSQSISADAHVVKAGLNYRFP